MFVTLTPEECAVLRKLAYHFIETCEPDASEAPALNIRHVQWFVEGACKDYTKGFQLRALDDIWDYLHGSRNLDTLDPFPRLVAVEAAKVFNRP